MAVENRGARSKPAAKGTASVAAPGMSTFQVVSYGAGDFAFNLSFQFCSLYLLYFYTDVLAIEATTAGLIIMVALIWEGITDPIVGVIANRTRSRWGRYRPYVLFGAVPLALSVVAMFLPLGFSGAALAAYCFATHLIYRTVFTFVSIPYISLSAQMTQDSEVRGKIAGARMGFAILCGLTLASLTLPLVSAFGGGERGFFIVSILYSVVATLILFFCFAVTSEGNGDAEAHAPNLRELWQALRTNRPFLLLLPATILGATAYTMSSKALIYYMKYWVGSEKAVTLALVTVLGCAALALFPWMIVTKRTSKRFVWLAGVVVNVVAYAVILLFKPQGGVLLWLPLAMIGIGNSAFILTFWSMLPDTVEFGEWKTGARGEGAIFGLISFAQKVSFGLGTGLIGILLDMGGYIANQPQSEAALNSITLTYAVGPLVLFAGSAVTIWFYPLDQKLHGRLVRAVGWRRRRSLGG